MDAQKKGFGKKQEWETFQIAQYNVNAEFKDIPIEADKLKDNWSKTIFSQAGQLIGNERRKQAEADQIKKMMKKHRKTLDELK